MGEIKGVISDFGGVLTTPLMDAFVGYQNDHDIPLASLGKAMQRMAGDRGEPPLFELERGQLSEADFIVMLGQALEEELGRTFQLRSFGDVFKDHLEPNAAMIERMHRLRQTGYTMALLTNNVREWEPHWRAMLPVDEIFEVIVDSAFVGMRKPEPAIYRLTLERLGLAAEQCLFIDDIELNCEAASELGMQTIHFRDTEQTLAELDEFLRI